MIQLKLEISAKSFQIFAFYYEYIFFMWLSVRMSARDCYISDDIYVLEEEYVYLSSTYLFHRLLEI